MSENFECPDCTRSFSTQSGLNSHYGQIHGGPINEVVVKCVVCGEELNRPLWKVEKGDNNICGDCHEKWSSRTNSGASNPMFGKDGEDAPFYGRSRDDEVKQSISESHEGKELSEEHKEKISESLSGDGNYWYGKERPEHSDRMEELHERGEFEE